MIDDTELEQARIRHNSGLGLAELQKGFGRHLDAVAIEQQRQKAILKQALTALGSGNDIKAGNILRRLLKP